MQIKILPATINHLPAILEIVNHHILHSTAVYDYEIKTISDMETWFTEKQESNWPILVANQGGVVTGYATYGSFKLKAGYKFTIEHSVYVSENHNGKGIGKLLMAELITQAKEADYHTMIGVIDADNTGSIEFHKKFGFVTTGTIKEVGYKFDRWLDVTFMQLILR